jgi:hypothetical protein
LDPAVLIAVVSQQNAYLVLEAVRAGSAIIAHACF